MESEETQGQKQKLAASGTWNLHSDISIIQFQNYNCRLQIVHHNSQLYQGNNTLDLGLGPWTLTLVESRKVEHSGKRKRIMVIGYSYFVFCFTSEFGVRSYGDTDDWCSFSELMYILAYCSCTKNPHVPWCNFSCELTATNTDNKCLLRIVRPREKCKRESDMR